MAENVTVVWFITDEGKGIYEISVTLPLFVSFALFMTGIMGKLKEKYKVSLTFSMLAVGMLYGLFIYLIVPKSFVEIYMFDSWHRFITKNLYLPSLTLHSLLSLNTRIFFRSFMQCFVLALCGSVVVFMMTLLFLHVIFKNTHEDWTTYDIAVLALLLNTLSAKILVSSLKHLDASEYLITVVCGEAILNNLITFTAYEIIATIRGFHHQCVLNNIPKLVIGFFVSLLVGYVGGKILLSCLKYFISVVSTAVTLTFILHLIITLIASGSIYLPTMPVLFAYSFVVLYEKEYIDVNILNAVESFHQLITTAVDGIFLTSLGCLTFRIGFRISSDVSPDVWHQILYIYMAISVFRFISIIAISPLLYKLGYGMNWKYSAILIWSQFRDTTALLPAFDLQNRNRLLYVVPKVIADKTLLITSVIVFASQLINHLSVVYIIRFLGVDIVSEARKRSMAYAILRIRDIIRRSTNVHKKDFLMASAHWDWISQYTIFEDPYSTVTPQEAEKSDIRDPAAMLKVGVSSNCPLCKQERERTKSQNDSRHSRADMTITQEEMEKLREEVFTRAINIAKVSYKDQLREGVIQPYIATKLTSVGDSVLERPGRYIEFEDIKKELISGKFYHNVQRWLDHYLPKIHESKHAIDWRYACGKDQGTNLLYEERRNAFRRIIANIVAHPQFEKMSLFRIIFSIIAVICTTIVIQTSQRLLNSVEDQQQEVVYQVESVVHMSFLAAFVLEILLKIIALGPRIYWKSLSNKLDVFIMTIGLLASIYAAINFVFEHNHHKTHDILSIPIYASALHLLFTAMLWLRNLCANHYKEQLYKNYDFAKGFEIGQKYVLRKLNQITDCEEIISYLKEAIDTNISQILREMAMLFQKHPEVSIAATTHLVSRKVIHNAMVHMVGKKNIVLHQADHEALIDILNKMRMEIMKAPASISTSLRCADIVCANSWIEKRTYRHLQKYLIIETHTPGTILQESGSLTKGVYVVMSGVVKVTGYRDSYKSDTLPSASSLMYLSAPLNEKFVDYLIVTQTIGLLGVLTRSPLITNAVCETVVETILIPTDKIYDVIEERCERPPLLYSAWRHVALSVATPILVNLIHYSATAMTDIRLLLSESLLPNLEHCTEFRRTDNIIDIFLIQGMIEDARTNMNYFGPAYIPRSVTTLRFPPRENRASRLVVLLLTNELYELPEEYDWEGTYGDKAYASTSKSRSRPHIASSEVTEALSTVPVAEEAEDVTAKEQQCYERFDDSFMHSPKSSLNGFVLFRYEALEKEMALRF